jgi:type IV fimbrial biogenesis protein FimT
MNAARTHQSSSGNTVARGLSLIETMCSLAIMAILIGGALPMFHDLHASQALQATAALLETDIQFAKSQASTSGRPVRLSVQAVQGGTSCYVVHTGAANACRCQGGGKAVCDAGATLLRLSEQSGPSGIALAPLQRSILFDAGKGTVTPTATFKVTDRDGRTIHQVVNIMGRVRSCTPNPGFAGLRTC